MACFVLVHGAWHGGWCWRRVADRLRRQHHEVHTPTLTGLGERRHLASESVDLAMHVQDITNVLFFEDLQDVVLVGHSYAGLVISGVANAVPERLAHLVYLDASTPDDGDRIVDLLPAARRQRLLRAIQDRRHLEEPPAQETFGISDAQDLAWLLPRLVPHPMTERMLFGPIPRLQGDALQLDRTYIACPADPDQGLRRALEDRGFSYRNIAAGHDAMVTAPDGVAEALLDCSR